MPMSSGRKMGTPLVPDPKPTDRKYRNILVVEVEKVGDSDQALPSLEDTTRVIESAIEVADLMNPESGLHWRVSYVGHV